MAKTIEFVSKVTEGDQLRVPDELLRQIPEGSNVHVILLVEPGDDLGPLRDLAMKRFAAMYDEDDYDYDQLLHDPPAR